MRECLTDEPVSREPISAKQIPCYAAASCFPAIFRGASCRPKRQSSIRRKIHERKSAKRSLNYALKSIDAVRTKPKQAMFYIECNPETVKSITSFPYIRKSS
jgi:hypothetical protein